jgi:hypothetical protein
MSHRRSGWRPVGRGRGLATACQVAATAALPGRACPRSRLRRADRLEVYLPVLRDAEGLVQRRAVEVPGGLGAPRRPGDVPAGHTRAEVIRQPCQILVDKPLDAPVLREVESPELAKDGPPICTASPEGAALAPPCASSFWQQWAANVAQGPPRLALSKYERPQNQPVSRPFPHAPARSRTWIYRLGGGRLIHWTTRALPGVHAAGRLKATVVRRPRPSARQTRPEPVRYDSAVDSQASRSSSSPTNRCVIHASIVCAPIRL